MAKKSKSIELAKNGFYESLRSLLGYTWAMFYFLIGGRMSGKSYAVMDFFLSQFTKKGTPFYWLRLTPASAKKILNNNAQDLVDPDLRYKYKLDLTVRGECVYRVIRRNDQGKILEKRLMCRVMALSTYYNNKGQGIFDKDWLKKNPGKFYNICLDEMNRETTERDTFDIVKAFANQLENIARTTKKRIRVICIGNTLDEASDILAAFNFIPHEFGRFKLKRHKAVVENIPITDAYVKRRKGSAADILAGDEPTFTNEIKLDSSRINTCKMVRPSYIIVFDKNTKFTVWDGNIVAPFNKEKCNQIAMRPALDLPYDKESVNQVINLFNTKSFWYRNLMTQVNFKKELRVFLPKR